MTALTIHAVNPGASGIHSLCGVLIDGMTATGHYPPIEPTGDKPACAACIRLSDSSEKPAPRALQYGISYDGAMSTVWQLPTREAAESELADIKKYTTIKGARLVVAEVPVWRVVA